MFRIQYGTQSILFMGDAEGKEREDSADVGREPDHPYRLRALMETTTAALAPETGTTWEP